MRQCRSEFLVFALILTVFMIIHAWDISNPAGYMIDYATLYQASYSVIHGGWLGDNYVPGVPLLTEHFSWDTYLTAWIALLPANIAYLAWWGLYYAVLFIFADRLARRLRAPWLIIALIAYPLSALNNPPENYLWVVLVPIGVALYWLGDYAYAVPSLAIGFAGIEYVGPYIAFAMDVTRSIHRYVVARERRVPWLAIASISTALLQAVALWLARNATHVVAPPLSTVIPDTTHNALLAIAKLVDYLVQGGVITFLPYPPALMLALLNYAPLAYASPLYTSPGYYLAPFYASLVTYTVFSTSAVRIGKKYALPVQLVVALALTTVIVYTLTLQLRGVDVITPPASYLVMAQALEGLVHNVTGVYLTNGLVCGYPPTWVVLHCAPYTQSILFQALNGTVYGPWNATTIGWVYPYYNLSNPFLNANPPFNFTTYSSAYVVLRNGTVLEIARLSVGNARLVFTPGTFTRLYVGVLLTNTAYAVLVTAAALTLLCLLSSGLRRVLRLPAGLVQAS